PADHAAAHEEGVDVDNATLDHPDQDSHQTVVAEPVDEPQVTSQMGVANHERAQLDPTVTTGREVELIRLADELLDTREVEFIERGDDSPHAQVTVEALDVR